MMGNAVQFPNTPIAVRRYVISRMSPDKLHIILIAAQS